MREILKTLNINVHSWDKRRQIEAALAAVPPELKHAVYGLKEACAVFDRNLAALNGGDHA